MNGIDLLTKNVTEAAQQFQERCPFSAGNVESSSRRIHSTCRQQIGLDHVFDKDKIT